VVRDAKKVEKHCTTEYSSTYTTVTNYQY